MPDGRYRVRFKLGKKERSKGSSGIISLAAMINVEERKGGRGPVEPVGKAQNIANLRVRNLMQNHKVTRSHHGKTCSFLSTKRSLPAGE